MSASCVDTAPSTKVKDPLDQASPQVYACSPSPSIRPVMLRAAPLPIESSTSLTVSIAENEAVARVWLDVHGF